MRRSVLLPAPLPPRITEILPRGKPHERPRKIARPRTDRCTSSSRTRVSAVGDRVHPAPRPVLRTTARGRVAVAGPITPEPHARLSRSRAAHRRPATLAATSRRCASRAPVSRVYDPLDYARRAARRLPRRVRGLAQARRVPRHEPGPVRHGADRRAVRRRRRGARLPRHRGAGRAAGVRAPEAAGARASRARAARCRGTRLWGAIARALRHPGAFLRATTSSRTTARCSSSRRAGATARPTSCRAAEREPLYRACDRHLLRLVEVLEPSWVVGIGAFAEARAREVLGDRVRVARVLHPSPASPLAQRDWAGTVRRELRAQGVCRSR